MDTTGADKLAVSEIDDAECSETMVEIKIKTLDSQIYTLRVNKCVPVPALKEQIATVTGVLSEQQRLICRGKVLKDDQLLSAYHVEDGHTLHLVVRQPFHTPSSATTGLMGSESMPGIPADPSNADGDRGNHVAHSVLLGTFNMGDQVDGLMPDLNRIVSAVLSSFRVNNVGSGVDRREQVTERPNRASGASWISDSTNPLLEQTAQVRSDSLHNVFRSPTSVSMGTLPPAVIPDSLATLFEYLRQMRHDFSAIERILRRDVGAASIHRMDGQDSGSGSRTAPVQGLPTVESLAEVMQSAREILVEQAGECLALLAGQLGNHANLTHSASRMEIQSNAIRSGFLLHNLGALLLELGRTTTTLRMGHTPAEAFVSAGPSLFISTSGPNPMMVQPPPPFQTGNGFGTIPIGTSGHGIVGGALDSGSGFLPRNIDIRIRTGPSTSAASAGHGERTTARQPLPHQQQEPANAVVPNVMHTSVSGISSSPTFSGRSSVRAVPIRTVVAAVPAALGHPPSDSAGSAAGLFYPLLASLQHLSSRHVNDTRASRASGEHHTNDPEPPRQQTTEDAVHHQTSGLNGIALEGEVSGQTYNHFVINESSDVSNVNFSANSSSLPLQGERFQNDQGSAPQITSRFDQLLRTVFPGEQINLSESVVARPQGHNMEYAEGNGTDEANEAPRAASEPGVFFSHLVRQIMPFVSHITSNDAADASVAGTGRAQRSSEAEPSTANTGMETPFEDGNSSSRDGPSLPSPKRQKRE